MQKSKFKSLLHYHFIVFIFGFTAILGALISLDATPLVWYRMVIGTLGLGIVLFILKQSFVVSRTIFFVAILSGIMISLHWITFFGAVKQSSVSLTLSVLSSGAFITSLLEPIFYRRKIILYEVLFGLLIIIGLILILNTQIDNLRGFVYAIISTFLAVGFTLINGKYVNKTNPYVLSFYELLVGCVVVSIVIIIGGGFSVEFFMISREDLIWIVILALICTSYAFVISIVVMRELSPYSIMLGINMEPVYGILLAIIIFGEKEKMSPTFYFGLFIILISVLLNGYLKIFKSK
ncbi:MAG: DMT family transporter [Bacteroidota bacterium]|nr:DMT family transporter [Bacteroidota bacterium]